MTGFFADKKRILSAVLTVIFAISFCAVAVCIIAAAPRDVEPEPQITVSDEPERITAPTNNPAASLPDDTDTTAESETEETVPTEVTKYTDNLKVDAPETTEAPEVDTEEETTALPEIEIVLDEKLFEEIVVPDPPKEPVYVVPDMKGGLLADELSLVHTIKKPTVQLTEEELLVAATVIQLEVMGNGSSLYRFEDICQKYWEMCAVAQCIRNRAESRYFPNTISGVIFQSTTLPNGRVIYQFSPADKLAKFTPTEEAMVAAREVLVEGVTILPQNYYYFCATRIEESFEKNNAYMFAHKSDGTLDKIQGHLTTFYAGHK